MSTRASVKEEAAPVSIGVVQQKPMPIQLRAIGNVTAYTTVSIKPQISGELQEIHFQEGQYVKKGDLLFQIDQRPFEAALKQAEANLKQAQANLAKDTADWKNNEAEAQRYQQLFKAGVAAAEQSEQFLTKAESSKAAIEADKSAIEADAAAIESARLQLDWTTIRAPMDGRTGSLMLHPGNLVKANDVPILVIINQIHPIFVSFAVPAQYLPEIKKQMAQSKLPVRAIPKEGGGQMAIGELTFVDNNIDPTTSMITLKALFQNEDNSLWPGQYVDAVMTLSTESSAIAIPSQAVQNSQQGQFVFVLKPDSTVEARTITVGRTVETESVVDKGLQPGERVVTEGQLRLVPGSKVREIKANQGSSS